MSEETQEATSTAETDEAREDQEDQEDQEGQEDQEDQEEKRESQPQQGEGKPGKTWYPYITKAQFEKFLSRLENKLPEQVDRDYIRAIIRTPSMIYRFLRGIEAMKLIDREQRPTDKLRRLVDAHRRKYTIAEIIRDLYPDLLEKWQKVDGAMSDDDIVAFFRSRTGMGRDSANKMKMFYKYLIGEADFGTPPPLPPMQEREKPAENAQQQAPQPPREKPAENAQQQAPQPPREKPAENAQQQRPQHDQERRSQERRTQSSQPSQPSQQPPSSQQQAPRNNGPQQQSQPLNYGSDRRPLTEAQKAYLQTLQGIVKINIDGDWDEDMIRIAFDRLERLFDRIRRS